MTILSDKDILGLVNHLYLASETTLPIEQENRLFWSLNAAISHIQTIEDDERIADIRSEMLQQFRAYNSNSHKTLVQWLCHHSIKIPEDKVYGPITSFLKLLSTLDCPKSIHTSKCSTLSLDSSEDSFFPPLKYTEKAIHTIQEHPCLKENYDRIFEILTSWKKIIDAKAIDPLSKQKLFEKTAENIKHLKLIQESPLSNDLSLVIFQQSDFFDSYPWKKIGAWIVGHSFSEHEGAYQLFDDFMRLIFGIHPLPSGYIEMKMQTVKTINENKKNGLALFTHIFNMSDLRNTYFKSKKFFSKISMLSKNMRELVIKKLISLINNKEISNQTLHLCSLQDVLDFFGKENCQYLRRLVFNHSIKFCLQEIVEFFPNIQHLSFYSIYNDPLEEKTLKQLTQLESLKFLMDEKKVDLDFLKHLPSLKKLKILSKRYENFNSLSTLKKLENLQIRLTSLEHLVTLQQLPKLNTLLLRSQLDCLDSLQHLKGIKKLVLRGCYGKFHFQNHQAITHLTVDTPFQNQEVLLNNLSSLTHLIMANIESCKCHINNLPALKELDLHYNFCDVNGLKNSINLIKLTVKNSQLTSDIAWIKNHPCLEILDLSDSKIKDVTPLKDLPNLKTLNLCNCSHLEKECLENILSFPSLKKLIITFLPIPNEIKLKLKQKGIILEYNGQIL